MSKSSQRRRASAAQRFKRILAASFMAASFLGGSLVWGDGPAQGIVNRYVTQAGAAPQGDAATETSGSQAAPASQRRSVRQASGELLLPQSGQRKAPRPAAIQAAFEEPTQAAAPVPTKPAKPAETVAEVLAPVVSGAEMRARRAAQNTAKQAQMPIAEAAAASQAKVEHAKQAASDRAQQLADKLVAPPVDGSASPSPWMQDLRQMTQTAPAAKVAKAKEAAVKQVEHQAEQTAERAVESAVDQIEMATQARVPTLQVEPIQPELTTPLAPVMKPESLAAPRKPSRVAPTAAKHVPAMLEAVEVDASAQMPELAGPKPATASPLAGKPVEEAPLSVVEVQDLAPPPKSSYRKTQPVALQPEEPVEELAPIVQPAADAPGMPAGSPFSVIEESGEVKVMVRRSKLLRTKVDVYRTAVVDDGICEVVQFTPRELSLIGKGQGSTHITFWFDDPKSQPITYLVKVEPDVAEVKKVEDAYKMLEDVINEMYPDSKIQLQVVAEKLIVKGQARDSEEAFQIITLIRGQAGNGGAGGLGGGFGGGLNEGIAAPVLSDSAVGNSRRSNLQVINMLRVPGIQQVALRVKIGELNRTAARNMGLSVQGQIKLNGNQNGAALFLNAITGTSGAAAPTLLTRFDGDDISLGLNTLQQAGVIRLLGEPTLVTMSGRPATFIAGGEFAVPTIVGSAGLNAVTTDFRAFGAIISFLPTVVDKDRIRLEVSPEFSQINGSLSVNNIPGLKTRAVTTTVEMREGQSLAIAGLIEDNMTANSSGDLPFLYRIFGKRSVQRNETELIIIVSPELVHPMDAEEVPPLPGFDVTEPNNTQFFLKGDLEGNPTQEYRSTVWPRLKKRYGSGGPAMTSGPFGHGK